MQHLVLFIDNMYICIGHIYNDYFMYMIVIYSVTLHEKSNHLSSSPTSFLAMDWKYHYPKTSHIEVRKQMCGFYSCFMWYFNLQVWKENVN